MQEVDEVEYEGVAPDHPCRDGVGKLSGIVHVQHIEVLIPSHGPLFLQQERARHMWGWWLAGLKMWGLVLGKDRYICEAT